MSDNIPNAPALCDVIGNPQALPQHVTSLVLSFWQIVHPYVPLIFLTEPSLAAGAPVQVSLRNSMLTLRICTNAQGATGTTNVTFRMISLSLSCKVSM